MFLAHSPHHTNSRHLIYCANVFSFVLSRSVYRTISSFMWRDLVSMHRFSFSSFLSVLHTFFSIWNSKTGESKECEYVYVPISVCACTQQKKKFKFIFVMIEMKHKFKSYNLSHSMMIFEIFYFVQRQTKPNQTKKTNKQTNAHTRTHAHIIACSGHKVIYFDSLTKIFMSVFRLLLDLLRTIREWVSEREREEEKKYVCINKSLDAHNKIYSCSRNEAIVIETTTCLHSSKTKHTNVNFVIFPYYTNSFSLICMYTYICIIFLLFLYRI